MIAHVQKSMDTYWSTNEGLADPPLVWDAFKAVAREESISAIKSARKDQNQEGEFLLGKERERVLKPMQTLHQRPAMCP